VIRWIVEPPPDATRASDLAAALNIPVALARLLIQRGHGEIDIGVD
jgi:hypothetical protein